jgi:hypothetical protein
MFPCTSLNIRQIEKRFQQTLQVTPSHKLQDELEIALRTALNTCGT